MPAIGGYVSRGSKNVGVRAYDGSPPFVMVGGQHLDRQSDLYLSDAELSFAVAAEAAHLRYDHTRVSSSEVWIGALSKGQQGIDIALGILPMLKGYRAADAAARPVSKLRSPKAQRWLKHAKHLGSSAKESALRRFSSDRAANARAGLSVPAERMIAAHQVMQLSADRVGLLLCGDPRAAIRAMFLVRADLAPWLPQDDRGLLEALEPLMREGDAASLNLGARIGHLIKFYLSDDYVTLRGRLTR